jgi:hypothetical protein
MTFKKTLISGAVVGAAALLLAGCSAVSSSSSAGTSTGTSSAVAKPTKTAAAPAIQPFNVGGLLAGNAKPTFAAGDLGKVAVVAQGPLNIDSLGASLPIAYRNNTDKAISHVDFTATARLNGKLVGTANSQSSTPAQVQPGEIGFALIYFDDSTSLVATGLTYEFQATTTPADKSSYNTAALIINESSNNGTAIIGTAVNKTGKPLAGPYSVDVYCFTGNDLTWQTVGFANETGDITAGAQVAYTVALPDGKCDTYTFGVTGYFK